MHADNFIYKINLCGSVTDPTACSTAMVCRTPATGSGGVVSFGEPKGYNIVKERGFLKFTYNQGDTCGKKEDIVVKTQLAG